MKLKRALDEEISFSSARKVDLIGLNEALETLAKFDEPQTRIVKTGFFWRFGD